MPQKARPAPIPELLRANNGTKPLYEDSEWLESLLYWAAGYDRNDRSFLVKKEDICLVRDCFQDLDDTVVGAILDLVVCLYLHEDMDMNAKLFWEHYNRLGTDHRNDPIVRDITTMDASWSQSANVVVEQLEVMGKRALGPAGKETAHLNLNSLRHHLHTRYEKLKNDWEGLAAWYERQGRELLIELGSWSAIMLLLRMK